MLKYSALENFFKENKIQESEVAEYLGIDVLTLRDKINFHNNDFDGNEVYKICRRYNLSANKFFCIFSFYKDTVFIDSTF